MPVTSRAPQATAVSPDRRWHVISEADQPIVERLTGCGVRGVEYVDAFPQDKMWVWLVMTTDAERDALLAETDPGISEIRAILRSLG